MTTDSELQAKAVLGKLVNKRKVPGIQYVMTDAERVRFEGCFGVMDVMSGQQVTPETTFMVSSVTKTLTAAAILQLHDQGRLDLQTKLSAYYEHPYENELRLYQLLNQSSGIPNPMPLRWLHLTTDHDHFDEEDALRGVMRRYDRLKFSPGARYAYSNLSYWLLGKVIEGVSGVAYKNYLRKNIFGPLGISQDSLDCIIPVQERHACGHLKRWSALGMLMPLMTDRNIFAEPTCRRLRFKSLYMNGPAYGGLVGTARALARFLQDQLGTKSVLFSNSTKELFCRQQNDRRGRPMETTLGWHRGSLDGLRFYGKPGGGPGYQSNIRIYPDRGIGSAWLANEMAMSEGPINVLTDKLDSNFL